ncbi:hypothetical protein GUITHDRAFT_142726 [Guillardia theta CCMP2712]|uniref:Uncharacterized protein n=2 Tax=Guillardia theta TaxID=55529 RepID=L1IX02_GUITC|nr:hypothetical protein GUITHDRAFT_142726 [Guillardia theta CCMP2712]EKX40404.1 hypothetical protein GUITHDRAFT_142726 [Guillardia theta CCMP2712]|eukprot:XP_005827384.1 hypothetical protein GUITHDRAFT_142726 [Guillardia theta CCMP2712]
MLPNLLLNSWRSVRPRLTSGHLTLSSRWGAVSDKLFSSSAKIIDVDGDKPIEPKQAEGHLIYPERAKNLLFANKRFQVQSYQRLPDDKNDGSSIFSDPNSPVMGKWDNASRSLIMFLEKNKTSHMKHWENISKIASASVATGHIDPPRLTPVFKHLELLPPTVRLVGDLVLYQGIGRDDHLKDLGFKEDDGHLMCLETHGVLFIDIFNKRENIAMRDFSAAYVDPLSACQHEILHIGNTKYFDYLPQFCRDFLGVPVEIAFMYAADRTGFSLFGLQDGTDDRWGEYRFPFTKETNTQEDFFLMIDTMIAEVEEAKKTQVDGKQ